MEFSSRWISGQVLEASSRCLHVKSTVFQQFIIVIKISLFIISVGQ